MRTSTANGFKLEVEVVEAIPHVRVSHLSGEVVIDTRSVSVTGLENLARVFESAARMAYLELERYYRSAAFRTSLDQEVKGSL